MSPEPARPIAYLSRRYRFSASHRLHVEALGEERNQATFGKCNNPFGHGHNYTVQVTLAGPVEASTGMVVNLADIDAFAREFLVEPLHLSNLNQHEAFAHCVPSTENLCLYLWPVFLRFAAEHGPVRLHRVRVEETSNNAFDYFGEGEPVLVVA